jgi:chemotaxis protein CheD
VSEDVGDVHPRKVLYYPASGRALVKKLSLHNDTIIQREQQYLHNLEHQPVAGEIDLF